MKFHHHQLFFERIVLFIVIAPSGIVYSKTYAACQPCLSVEKPRRPNPAPPIDINPFLQEQCLLHVKSSLVSAERPVGADRAMAWYHDRKGVCRQGVARGAGTLGNAQMGCDSPVRAHGAPRDAIFRQKDSLLKRGTKVHSYMLEGKTDIGTVEKRRDPPGQIVDESAGGRDGVGKMIF
jgi:hypothetical protein